MQQRARPPAGRGEGVVCGERQAGSQGHGLGATYDTYDTYDMGTIHQTQQTSLSQVILSLSPPLPFPLRAGCRTCRAVCFPLGRVSDVSDVSDEAEEGRAAVRF